MASPSPPTLTPPLPTTPQGLDEHVYKLLERRTYDLAGVTHSSVKVWLNGKKLGCNNFAQYVDLYLGPKLKPGSAPCEQRAKSATLDALTAARRRAPAPLPPRSRRAPAARLLLLTPLAVGCATHSRGVSAPLGAQ